MRGDPEILAALGPFLSLYLLVALAEPNAPPFVIECSGPLFALGFDFDRLPPPPNRVLESEPGPPMAPSPVRLLSHPTNSPNAAKRINALFIQLRYSCNFGRHWGLRPDSDAARSLLSGRRRRDFRNEQAIVTPQFGSLEMTGLSAANQGHIAKCNGKGSGGVPEIRAALDL